MRDDRGPWLAVGASYFCAANRFKHDRAAFERNCRWLAEHGVDYIRALGCVGVQPFWEGREVDPAWPDYSEIIDGTTQAALEYGLRVMWTAFGDAQVMAPADADKEYVIDAIADVCDRHRAAVLCFEVANEAWQNGFPGAAGIEQMKRLAKRFADQTDVPIAITCPYGENGEAQLKSATALYKGSVAHYTTNHYDRQMSEDGWRPARQPWQQRDYSGVPGASANSEPIGIGQPGGNNPTDANPHRQVSQAIVSWISGHWGYVLHDRAAGVRADIDWSAVQNIDAITASLQAVRDMLPCDLPNGSAQNDHWSGHPFKTVDKWVDGAPEGCTRAYASVQGSDFVCLPMGIKGGLNLVAKAAMDLDVNDILTGAGLKSGSLSAGQSMRLPDTQPVYLVRGRWR